MVHGMIQGVLLDGPNPLSTIEFVVITITGFFFYLSRYRGKFNLVRIPLIFLINIVLVVFWFWLSGYYGSTGIGAAAVGLINILLIQPKWRIRLVLISSGLMILLVVLQVKTDWVSMSPQEYATLPYDYLVLLFGMFLVVVYLKSEFDKERSIAMNQNHELGFLNRELKQSLKEKEKALEALQSTQQKLIESEKMASIGRLTAGLAHELNNPLNFIGGNIHPIKKDFEELKEMVGPGPEKQQFLFEEINALLENIEQGSSQAYNVIENLLKIDPRAIDDRERYLDLSDIIVRTCALVQRANPQVSIVLDIAPGVIILGSIIEINQVLLNLLKNGIDAIQEVENPEIRVELTHSKKKCKITVSDNGHGIPSSIQNHLFEPFFTTKSEGVGTGLGLYISYGIVKKHGGSIDLESELNKGAKFFIKLPLK